MTGGMIGRRDLFGHALSFAGSFAVLTVISRRISIKDHQPSVVSQKMPGMKPGDLVRLNVALNLAYLGAQYHRRAATGNGLPPRFLAGIGKPGAAHGGRRVVFRDPELARYANDIAGDLVTQIAVLRNILSDAAAAQPAIDLSGAMCSAFAAVGRAARLNAEAATFDPFSGDEAFLLGALLIGNEVAACHRALLAGMVGASARAAMGRVLAEAIYHGGLIRSLLVARATANPTISRALASLCAMQARPSGGTRRASASGTYGSDLIDAAGNPIPFLRTPAQVMTLPCLPDADCLTSGFFPEGLNGISR